MHPLITLPSDRSVNGESIPVLRSAMPAKKFCYLIAGTHGDEPEGIYVQNALVEWLRKSEIITPFIILPTLNPDGFKKKTRCNANGVDLNRNLPASNWQLNESNDRYYSGPKPLSEPENEFLLSLFSQYPPGLIISFHSWKPMLNSNGDCEDIIQLLQQYNSYPIVREEIDDHPTPGSLGSYVSETLNIPVLTFECPVLEERPDLESIWMENKKDQTMMMRTSSLPWLVQLLLSGLIDRHL